MKRSILSTAIAFLAVAAVAHAQSAIQATDTVNVRSGPGTQYGVIGQVPPGHVYVAFDMAGAWCKIFYNGGYGYTHSSYYKVIGAWGAQIQNDAHEVYDDWGNVVGTVYHGQVYISPLQESGWAQIFFQGGLYWILDDNLNWIEYSGGSDDGGSSGPAPDYLGVPHAWQVNGYYCGPTSVQMIVAYLTGQWYSQSSIASYVGTSSTYGTSAQQVNNGINSYAGAGYWVAYWLNRDKVIANINSYRPVNLNFNCKYLAYWSYKYILHHSPTIGYTGGGYWIHDTARGPDKWASSAEVWNAVNYHYGLYNVRY